MVLKLGISSCLLGERVRYDGGHKLNHYLKDVLGPFVEWVPVCPEYECGLKVPREAMRLVGDPESPRLMTIRTGIDLTGQMLAWIDKRLTGLAQEHLCGFIFKKGSPSSGYSGVKVYTEAGHPGRQGMGLFARAFVRRFPRLPVEDEGRLNDAGIRENFLERIFVYQRWQEFEAADESPDGLIRFHTCHKLLIMAHSPAGLKDLGQMVAQISPHNLAEIQAAYFDRLMQILSLAATVRKNRNVLDHMMGYFKKDLSGDEKQELKEWIERYHQGFVPLLVPITLLNHYVRKYRQPYLSDQIYLNPCPQELLLRNHV